MSANNTIDLTQDSDGEEYRYWPRSNRRIRKSITFNTPNNTGPKVRGVTKKTKRSNRTKVKRQVCNATPVTPTVINDVTSRALAAMEACSSSSDEDCDDNQKMMFRHRPAVISIGAFNEKCDVKYVGAHIAKYFGNELYFGTVTFVDKYYHVEYDDGDEEDFDLDGLSASIRLYEESQKKQHGPSTPHQSQAEQESNHGKWKGPTLFDIHDVSQHQIEAVRTLLPLQHQERAELITEFFLLCYERQLIWQRKKQSTQQELTTDAKLANRFYCNVYRELDRGTQYFRANLIHHRSNSPSIGNGFKLEDVLWDSLCYRLINKIETFESYGRIPCREEWKDFERRTLESLWNNNEIVFTGAHQSMGKHRYLTTMTSLWKQDGKLINDLATKISFATNLKSCYHALLQVENVGKFLAWQVLCDLLESHVIPFSEDDWVQLGPGGVNGLNLIFGKSLAGRGDRSEKPLEKTMLLRRIQGEVYGALELAFPRFLAREMTLKNIEHALCEFCKYKDDHVTRRYDVNGRGSRSRLDTDKSCRNCYAACATSSQSQLCDLCRTPYCESCSNESGQEIEYAWLCTGCIHVGNKDVI